MVDRTNFTSYLLQRDGASTIKDYISKKTTPDITS